MNNGIFPIYRQVVGALGAASVTFNNIPQIYDDLKINIMARDTRNNFAGQSDVSVRFNSDASASYSIIILRGNGSSTPTGFIRSAQTEMWISDAATSLNTAGAFSSSDLYIPNYTKRMFKSVSGDAVMSSMDASQGCVSMHGGLWKSADPIRSITFIPLSPNFQQYSTFSLYGIGR